MIPTIAFALCLSWSAGLLQVQEATPVAAPATHALAWKVVARDSATVGYLVGSIHVLSPDYYPLDRPVEAAFDRSATIVGEVHPDELGGASAARMLARALYTDGRTLEQDVTPETWELLRTRLAATGLPLEAFERMRPWMAALTLTTLELQRSGLQPEYGVDRYFFDKARTAGKPVEGLETLDQQIERLDGLSPRLQEELIREMLRDADAEAANVKQIADAWRAGDAAVLERLLVAELQAFPELYQRLLVERNRTWLPHLEACFSDRSPCFIVVGAAHLLGRDGLVAMLQARGYRLEAQ